MNETATQPGTARVASLHLHPAEAGKALASADTIEVVEAKGILGEPRYFGRISSRTGEPSLRQVSLMAREEIAGHAEALGILSIPPGAVRSNIETEGIDLVACLGRELRIGDAVLLVYEARMPCNKMDAICAGLKARMTSNRQGVLAQVIQGGRIRVGDPITVGPTRA